MSMSQHPEPMNGILFEERVFADVTKGLKMRSFWIIWVGTKSSNKHPRKRLAVERQKMAMEVTMQAETGVIRPRAQGGWSPQKPEQVGRTLCWNLRRECGPVTVSLACRV